MNQASDIVPPSPGAEYALAPVTHFVESTPFADDAAQERSELLILGVTSVAHYLCHLAEVMFPCVLLAVLMEFGLDPAQGTLLALLGYVLLGVGALPVGAWADAWDTRKIMGIYFGVMALTGAAVAAASTPLLLFAALTGLGLAASIYHPAGLAMLSLGCRRRSRAMGINGVAGNLGIASAPIVAWLALTYLGSWRWAYGLLAVLSAAAAAVMLLMAWRGQMTIVIPKPVRTVGAAGAHDAPRGGLFPLIMLLAVTMLAGLNYRCLITALPTYLTGETGPAGQLARGGLWFTSLALLAGSIGQLLGGYLGDRFGARKIYLMTICTLAPIALVLSLLEGDPAAALVAGCLAVPLFAQQPVENALVAESTSAARRSLSYGWKFVLTFGFGAMGAQVVGSIWSTTGSLAPVFWVIAGSALLMVMLMTLRPK